MREINSNGTTVGGKTYPVESCKTILWDNMDKNGWYLIVNGVQVAYISHDEGEGNDDGDFCLYDYDTDFAGIFENGTMPHFKTLEIAQAYVMKRFRQWFEKTIKSFY